jgi:hypothetical protein
VWYIIFFELFTSVNGLSSREVRELFLNDGLLQLTAGLSPLDFPDKGLYADGGSEHRFQWAFT